MFYLFCDRIHRNGGYVLRHFFVAVFAFATTIFGLINNATAQPMSSFLTLDAALDSALSRSGKLKAREAEVHAASELAISAARLPDPVLSVSMDNVPIEGDMRYSLTDDFMTMTSVGVMQTFTGSEKREARGARFEREAEALSMVRTVEQTQVLIRTGQAWFERFYQEKTLELLHAQRDEAERVRTAVESAYRSRRSSQADLLAAHAAVVRIDDRLYEVNAELENAKLFLRRWVGDAALLPLGGTPQWDRTRMSEHPLTHEIDQHPDIALMDARERVALADVELAKLEKNADLSWSFMYSKRGNQFGDMISVGVSIPLQFNQSRKQDREISARLAQVEQVRSEREEMRREHLYEVQRLLANWRANLKRLDEYDNTLLPLVTERVAAEEAAFRSGEVSLATVLEARRAVIDTYLDRLRIEKQTALWWVELEFLVPRDQATQASINSTHRSNRGPRL